MLVKPLTGNVLVHSFSVPGEDSTGAEDAVRKFPLDGQVEVSSARIRPGVFRFTIRVRNVGAFPAETRDDALVHSLASAHAILELSNGAFVSQVDAPETLRDDVAACQNIGVWPVLVGEAGTRVLRNDKNPIASPLMKRTQLNGFGFPPFAVLRKSHVNAAIISAPPSRISPHGNRVMQTGLLLYSRHSSSRPLPIIETDATPGASTGPVQGTGIRNRVSQVRKETGQ